MGVDRVRPEFSSLGWADLGLGLGWPGREPGIPRYYPGTTPVSGTFPLSELSPRSRGNRIQKSGITWNVDFFYKTNSNDSMGGWPVSPTPEICIFEKVQNLMQDALFWEACAKSL